MGGARNIYYKGKYFIALYDEDDYCYAVADNTKELANFLEVRQNRIETLLCQYNKYGRKMFYDDKKLTIYLFELDDDEKVKYTFDKKIYNYVFENYFIKLLTIKEIAEKDETNKLTIFYVLQMVKEDKAVKNWIKKIHKNTIAKTLKKINSGNSNLRERKKRTEYVKKVLSDELERRKYGTKSRTSA